MPLFSSDDTAAPGHFPEAAGLPWRRRLFLRGGGYLVPSSLFVLIPLYFAWGRLPWPSYAALVADCLAIDFFYLGTVVVVRWSHGARWAWVGGLILSILALAWISGDADTAAYFVIFACIASATLLPWAEARILAPAVALVGVSLGVIGANPSAAILALAGGFMGYSVGMGLENAHTRGALRNEERRTAALAVAAERERIGRDLHDILGHSLTAIAVKADLAGRLVSRDPARAEAEIADLGRVARQALADVRATASGMREVRLATEVAAARSVLGAAGVTCHAPSALPVFDDEASELLGYVVREAVTNVVRHAGAATCTIGADEASVTIADDGRGIRAEAKGTGLAGLKVRVEAVGGRLSVASDATGTTVRAQLGVMA